MPAALASDDSLQVLAAELSPRAERVVAALDHRGRWLEDGMINSATFVANVNLLARYVAVGEWRAAAGSRPAQSLINVSVANPGSRAGLARQLK